MGILRGVYCVGVEVEGEVGVGSLMKIVKQMDEDIERDDFDIPKWQQEITMKRVEEYDADASKAVDFDMILRDVEQKYEL